MPINSKRNQIFASGSHVWALIGARTEPILILSYLSYTYGNMANALCPFYLTVTQTIKLTEKCTAYKTWNPYFDSKNFSVC